MTRRALMQQSRVAVPSNAPHAPILDATYHRTGQTRLQMSSKYSVVDIDILFLQVCRWLYRLNLTKDANFRLKNKAHGVKNDLPLGDGWAHWVPEGPYQEYIAKYGYQVEVRYPFLTNRYTKLNIVIAKPV